MINESFVAIICGSRHIREHENLELLKNRISSLNIDIVEVVSGSARGGDYMGELWSDEHKVDLTIMPANWGLHGRSAGPIRNRRMLNYALNHLDKFTPLVIALWDGHSRGTQHMINIATSARVLVNVIGVESNGK